MPILGFTRIDQPAPDRAYRRALWDCIHFAQQNATDSMAAYLYSLPLDAPRAKLMSAVFNTPKGTFGALVASRIASL